MYVRVDLSYLLWLQCNIDAIVELFGEVLDHSRAVLSDAVTGVNVSLKDVARNMLSYTSTCSLFF